MIFLLLTLFRTLIVFINMKLTLQTQLLPNEEQGKKLKATVERFNEATNWRAGEAFDRTLANKIALQILYYRALRSTFDLSAQMAIRCIAQVVAEVIGRRQHTSTLGARLARKRIEAVPSLCAVFLPLRLVQLAERRSLGRVAHILTPFNVAAGDAPMALILAPSAPTQQYLSVLHEYHRNPHSRISVQNRFAPGAGQLFPVTL